MRLHEDNTLFRQAVQLTADQVKIPAIYIEKDYWVTYALFRIFQDEIGKEVVFKGGTALAKCYDLIERFSEDIDLVVLRREGETYSRLKSKLKTISTVVADFLPEVAVEGITHKKGMNRKTAHRYAKSFTGKYGQVREVIVVESSWLGYYEPFTTRRIISFVGKMMLSNNQEKIAADHGLLPFELRTLEPVRTICEKIMSLVRFSYSEEPITQLKNKIRHTYDLHQLLRQTEFSDFLQSAAFDEMLLKVAQDDIASFRNNNAWLAHHPGKALFFASLENIWKELAPVYTGDFSNLVYGDLPAETSVLDTLQRIKDRLGSVSWSVTLKAST